MTIPDLMAFHRRLLKRHDARSASVVMRAVELVRYGNAYLADVLLERNGLGYRSGCGQAGFPAIHAFNRTGSHEARAISHKPYPAHLLGARNPWD